MRFSRCLRVAVLSVVVAAGCGSREKGGEAGRSLIFWHSMAQANGELLQEIVNEYNASDPPMPVVLRYIGDYMVLFQKARATIGTGKLPDLLVGYPSMVAEYVRSDVAVELGEYIEDPEIGLSDASLADVFPTILESTRFDEFDGRHYAFPFTKSVLMLYYNQDLLRAAGFDGPPETWTEFRAQCLAVKEKLGKQGYALSVDASTFAAAVMSLGGELIAEDGSRTLLGEGGSLEALRLIQELARSGAAYQIDRHSYGDRREFTARNCAFMVRSSTTRPYLDADIQGGFEWDMGLIPHGEGRRPVTVLFGADVAILKSTPERQRAAWAFVKHFSSAEVTAKWATGTGYLPVRQSAGQTERFREFAERHPRNRRALDTLPYARTEPSAAGWQAVRTLIEQAESRAIGGRAAPEEIAKELAEKADRALLPARE